MIELMVVVGILGMLMSLVLASLSSARNRSRALSDVASLKEIEKALALYISQNQSAPSAASYGENGPWWACADDALNDTNGNGIAFMEFLITSNSIPLIAPPKSSATYFYSAKNECGCMMSGNPEYMLVAYNLRTAILGVTDNDPGDNPAVINPICGLSGPNNFVVLR